MKQTLNISLAAALTCASLGVAPAATADPARVPCGVLDQVRESLDNDINAGIGGVRIVISSPYASGAAQQRDTNVKLAMISHGVHYMEDVNGPGIVPGLAPALVDLRRASDDMRDAVGALFVISGGGYGYGLGYGGYGPTVSNAWPQPSTWTAIDYADQKKDDIYALVNGLQPTCQP
ncbi:hypothetical protein FHT40_003499 [Mycolicibacterium sp. BK556]|uniref:hypothetical protein n=1 Tax=Mycobacteriaceae TaxID=1762 RepID=UPI00105EA5E2|nr:MULTISPECIES: hypothetical protein [Mycobacteriaceae]MBB3603838.1 hypothetical protein [Mycolicibacterium sp. BK556]MBB3634033.1 hypothetical protein [Mycolicibacterium sp. BK607]MBB3751614.1 hypothetical protein [Mycolicibacterium sp. BK634]TDO12128.1 hypothetical protein EV580_3854 [Mycobacterium sp. BK086]